MTDIEQDLLIAQAEAKYLRDRLIERGLQLGEARKRERLLYEELEALRMDVLAVCAELHNLCRSGRPEPAEVLRGVLAVEKIMECEKTERSGDNEKRNQACAFEREDTGGAGSGAEG